jgi:REP element-mobilizing transposase RayT
VGNDEFRFELLTENVYFVSTIGRDEQVIRQYIRNQEKEDERMEQLGLWR